METEQIRLLSLDSSLANLRSVKELDTAINDLLSYNYFSVVEDPGGPYTVTLSIADNRMVFNIDYAEKRDEPERIHVSLRSFRSLVKDYLLVCESYQEALHRGSIDRIEAIDMGRRGIHNEGSEALIELLENKINMDLETARRFFTIITVLHMR